MSLVLLPSLIALLIKVSMLFRHKCLDWAGIKWLGLVSVYALLNLSEFVAYFAYISGVQSSYLLKCYYFCTVLVLAYSFGYVVDRSIAVQQYLFIVLALAASTLSGLFFFTDLMIEGFVIDGYLITAKKQSLFWAFEVMAIVSAVLIVAILIYNYAKAVTQPEKVAYFYTILAIFPLAMSVIIIMTSIALGLGANGVMIIHVAATFFLLITAKGKDSTLIEKDPRLFNPLSNEAKLAKRLLNVQTQTMLGNLGLKEAISDIEAKIIAHAIEQNSGNISETARQLQVSRSNLSLKWSKIREDVVQ